MSNQQSSTSGASLACIEDRSPTVSFWEKLWKVLRTDLGVAIHNWSMERIARKERNRGAKTMSPEEVEARMGEEFQKEVTQMYEDAKEPPAPSLDDLLPGARKLYDRILQRIESKEFTLRSDTPDSMVGLREFRFEFDNMTAALTKISVVGMEEDLNIKVSVKHSGEMHRDLMPSWAVQSLWDAATTRQEEKQEEEKKTMDQKILELLDS